MTDDYSGWYNSHDWDETNKRLKDMPEQNYELTPPKASRYIPRHHYYDIFKQETKKKVPLLGSRKRYDGIELIEATTGYVSTERPNDIPFERVQMRAGENYVTIVRYDGDPNNMVVDVNGRARSVSSDNLDDVINGMIE